MQLKLFQYKQVEQSEPTQGEPPKRRSCCCGRLFVTACLVALLITFVAFVVPQLYSGRFNDDVAEFNAVYGDASSESSDEQLDIAIKEAFRGRQMTKDRPIIRPLVIRPDSEEEVDSLEPKIDAKQDKLEKMLEQELARVKQEEFKNIDVRDDYVEDDFDKQDRADIRARIQELMQQKASKNDGDLCEPNMADEWAVEVNEAVDVAPASELESDLPEVQLFGKWSRQEVNFADISLVDYIAVKENLIKFSEKLRNVMGRCLKLIAECTAFSAAGLDKMNRMIRLRHMYFDNV
ncbi:hypothetical protein PRIPAC_84360 [Pristionchus pacificus]|uniref:Uncharacterized protein n=1 Tax=Pristionchus pacificus TaxID=54126 RepID=A0A2A6BSV0_PRIPA|nr:hypothetical protein PRIPAC_84360 [Pristionchus pacificus]|eukprot:PDM68955.1 hypothetical protein PRIPAC_47257 [Pristionchus pacificus]